MACKSARFDEGCYICEVSGSGCVFMIPDSKRCAEEYGEGPDVEHDKCEDCADFYMEGDKRCCKKNPLRFEETTGDFVNSKYIEDNILSCGGFYKT